MPKKCRTARKIKRCKPLDEELLKAWLNFSEELYKAFSVSSHPSKSPPWLRFEPVLPGILE